jgi:serine/threonine-protein kinase
MEGQQSGQRWRLIEDLFARALEQPESDRSSFLDEACGDDAQLRQAVSELLQADAAAGDFLDPTVATGQREAAFAAGSRIGPYRIADQIGSGGTSSVYLAVRDDEYHQRVSIKVLRIGLDEIGHEQRFRKERQILAGLDHPNISKLLDGGTTDHGAPYLVMEYIDGLPIDSYCEENRMGLRARLELFLKILAAVQYAHQNLVVHRDLKPSNILVRHDGEPKLLDFGIAKLMNPELGGQIDPTRADLLLMTPHYASPEQIAGGTITTATDVYSLGVLLYRTLTSLSPYQIDTGNVREIVLAVCEQDPKPPSRVVADQPNAPVHRRELAGDLDHIVLKAMAKEPRDRYATASQLAGDIRRHLDGRPVLARGAALSYRLGKLIRRHRWVLATTLSLLVLITTFVVNTIVQSRRTTRALAAEEVARSQAEAINSFLLEMLTLADPTIGKGRDVTVLEAMQRAEETVAESLAGQPRVEATVRHVIGSTYEKLGEYEAAEAMLRSALELRRREPDRPADTAVTLSSLGMVLIELAKFDEAEQVLTEAISMADAELGPAHLETLQSQIRLGTLLRRQGRLEEAEPIFRTVQERSRSTIGARQLGITALQNIGIVHAMRGDMRSAAESLELALTELRSLLGEAHPSVATAHHNLGYLRNMIGDYNEAAEELQRALALREQIFGTANPLTAVTRSALAEVRYAVGDLDGAQSLLDQALTIQRETLGEDHLLVAENVLCLALVELELGQAESAEQLLAQARPIITGEDDYLSIYQEIQARIHIAEGNLGRAETVAREALRLRSESLGEDDLATASSHLQLGDILTATGALEEAGQHYQQALGIFSAKVSATHYELQKLRLSYGRYLTRCGRFREAEQQLDILAQTLSTVGHPARQRQLEEARAQLIVSEEASS